MSRPLIATFASSALDGKRRASSPPAARAEKRPPRLVRHPLTRLGALRGGRDRQGADVTLAPAEQR